MKDRLTDIPESPEPTHREWVIKNVDSATVRLLEDWLQEKAQLEEHETSSDVFSREIDQLLYRELGVEEVTKRYNKYRDEQNRLQGALIRYCDETGYEPDLGAYEEAYPDTDPSP